MDRDLRFLAAVAGGFVLCIVGAWFTYVRQLKRSGARSQEGSDHAVPTVGILHPNAGGGGGGERVLWVALLTLMAADRRSNITRKYVLYTKRYPAPGTMIERTEGKHDDSAVAAAASPTHRSPSQRLVDERDTANLLSLVSQQFGIDGIDTKRLDVVYLKRTEALDPKHYRFATLLLQSFIGGIAMFWDVASQGVTDIIVDTVGIPLSYWLFSIVSGCTVATYVHYPTISTDMIAKVAAGRADFNNNATVARSGWLTRLKLWYYRAFAVLYRWFGGNFASVVMTNSSWTDDHIRTLWQRRDTRIVYPPCSINRFANAAGPLVPGERKDMVVSVGQFRPEKNHRLQIDAFALALNTAKLPKGTTLYMVGGTRDDGDRRRVEQLERHINDTNMRDHVFIETNVPAARVLDLLSKATVGLHTMTDEHFGIVVAEYMAAGAIAIAHNSAGPKRDIVTPDSATGAPTGFLCATREEYALALGAAFDLRRQRPDEWEEWTKRARRSAMRFSDKYFARGFAATLAPVLALTLLPEDDDDGVKLCC